MGRRFLMLIHIVLTPSKSTKMSKPIAEEPIAGMKAIKLNKAGEKDAQPTILRHWKNV